MSTQPLVTPRIYHPQPLAEGMTVTLPAAASRHVQVLRLQPGDTLALFGDPVRAGEWCARVLGITRASVTVQIDYHRPVDREPQRPVHLVVGMPANERMDWLVEKATELGVASLQPLVTQRTVLRLSGERAERRLAHWRAVAVAACEQCGGNRVPLLHPVRHFGDWLADAAPAGAERWRVFLSLSQGARAWPPPLPARASEHHVLLGPEGGLSAQEEQALLAAGWQPLSLGPRVLRSETAALAVLTLLTLGGA